MEVQITARKITDELEAFAQWLRAAGLSRRDAQDLLRPAPFEEVAVAVKIAVDSLALPERVARVAKSWADAWFGATVLAGSLQDARGLREMAGIGSFTYVLGDMAAMRVQLEHWRKTGAEPTRYP